MLNKLLLVMLTMHGQKPGAWFQFVKLDENVIPNIESDSVFYSIAWDLKKYKQKLWPQQ